MAMRTVGLAVFALLLAFTGYLWYENHLESKEGLMVPSISLEQQRARRQEFYKFAASFMVGRALVDECKGPERLQYDVTMMEPLLNGWQRRHYFYTVHLRYGHMPRAKAVRDFDAMVKTDMAMVRDKTHRELQKQGGCQGEFARQMQQYIQLQLTPLRVAEVVPEYDAQRLNNFSNAYTDLFGVLGPQEDLRACGQAEAAAGLEPKVASLKTTARERFAEALPLDGAWARQHFDDVLQMRLAMKAQMRALAGVESFCKKDDNRPPAY